MAGVNDCTIISSFASEIVGSLIYLDNILMCLLRHRFLYPLSNRFMSNSKYVWNVAWWSVQQPWCQPLHDHTPPSQPICCPNSESNCASLVRLLPDTWLAQRSRRIANPICSSRHRTCAASRSSPPDPWRTAGQQQVDSGRHSPAGWDWAGLTVTCPERGALTFIYHSRELEEVPAHCGRDRRMGKIKNSVQYPHKEITAELLVNPHFTEHGFQSLWSVGISLHPTGHRSDPSLLQFLFVFKTEVFLTLTVTLWTQRK